MSPDKHAERARIAAELARLRQAAVTVGEPFLAYLIAMAVVEAEKPGG